MNFYLADDTIINLFDIILWQLEVDETSSYGIFSNILRSNVESNFNTIFSNEFFDIVYDELGLIDLVETLGVIKSYYCNSFCQDDHISLLSFISDVIHDLGNNTSYENFFKQINEELRLFNLGIAELNGCKFLGEIIDELNGCQIYINVLKMYRSFQNTNRIEMVQERVKDAIFLFKNNRYTACLALVAFALEGFLRGIFGNSYDENEERYKVINARLCKSNDNSSLNINYPERLKPSIDYITYNFDNSKHIDLHIRKIREKNDNSVLEVNIKNEYAGLICLSDKETVKKHREYDLAKLINKAVEDNLIDNRVFQYDSFDFLRKIRNNIVHFDDDHKEVTQHLKAKKILLKIIEFINTRLYA